MRLWLNNRLDAEYDTSVDELAQRFWASRQGRLQLNPSFALALERSLRDWLTDPDGQSSTWEDESEQTGFGALFARVRETWPKCRFAKVTVSASRIGEIAAYLPPGYWITAEVGGSLATQPWDVYIQGIDNAGWTLDGYVIPRLGSGLIHAEEITKAEAAEAGA